MKLKKFKFIHPVIAIITLTTLAGVFLFGSDRVSAVEMDSVSSIVSNLKAQNAKISLRHDGKTVGFIGSASGQSIANPGATPSSSHRDAAALAMKNIGGAFGITRPDSQLRLMKDRVMKDGRSMVRYQQVHEGVPILAAELIVNLDKNNNIKSINGETATNTLVSTAPSLLPETASAKALQVTSLSHSTAISDLSATTPELWIFQPDLIGPPRAYRHKLVWKTEVTSKKLAPIRELVLVDAENGRVLLNFNQTHKALDRRTHDTNSAGRAVYDDLPGPVICQDPVISEEACSGTVPDADDAHHFAGDTYNFLLTNHGRDSLDDSGMTLISTARYCPDVGNCPYANAFWNGTQMVYGAGLVLDDVVGHELAHGLTSKTSNLLYWFQSGAISESLSDVWGEFVDQTNDSDGTGGAVKWLLGEDYAGGTFRDMANPPALGDPDSTQSGNYVADITALDNGGVHTNSGVNNKAAYLMTDGDTFNAITVSPLGIAKVADIYYEAQTNLLTSGSNYRDLYNALIQACNNLVGLDGVVAADCLEVKDAVDAVQMDVEPVVFPASQATICPAGQFPNHAFYDDMESGSANWTFSTGAGATNWRIVNNIFGTEYAPSGSSVLHAPGVAAVSDMYAAITVNVPAGSPMLHFRHYFEFEVNGACVPSNYCDGGVIEYSTNGGGTWIDAGGLIVDGRAYEGTINNDFSNPLGGQMGFGGSTPGYSSTRVDLSSLATMNNVMFRWRSAGNIIIDSLAWLVDDVRVYTCSGTPDANMNPTLAALVGPADGSASAATDVTLLWNAATDPDGDALSYRALMCEGVACTNYSQVGTVQSAMAQLNPKLMLASLGGTSLLLIGFVAAGGSRRKLKQTTLLLFVSLLLASCGGSSSSGSSSAPPGPPSDFQVTAFNLNPASTYRWLIRTEDGKGGSSETAIQTFTTN